MAPNGFELSMSAKLFLKVDICYIPEGRKCGFQVQIVLVSSYIRCFVLFLLNLRLLNQFLSERFGYNLNAQSKSMNTTMVSITQLTERRVNEARQYVYVVIDSSTFG